METFLFKLPFTVEFKWTILIFGLLDGVMGMMMFVALGYYQDYQTGFGNR